MSLKQTCFNNNNMLVLAIVAAVLGAVQVVVGATIQHPFNDATLATGPEARDGHTTTSGVESVLHDAVPSDFRQEIPLSLPLPNDWHNTRTDADGGAVSMDLPAGFELWNQLRDGWSTSSFIILPQFDYVDERSRRRVPDEVDIQYAPLVKFSGSEPRAGPPRNADQASDEAVTNAAKIIFASQLTVEQSVSDSSPTLLIDAETGERVEHFVEALTRGTHDHLRQYNVASSATVGPCADASHGMSPELRQLMGEEMFATFESAIGSICSRRQGDIPVSTACTDQVLVIRPAAVLKSRRRYIVALKQLPSAARPGKFVAAPPDFVTVRDDTATDDQELKAKQQFYRERRTFETLLHYGHVKDLKELTYAWDFTTASEKTSTETLAHMRDTAFALLQKWRDGRLAGLDTDAFTYRVNSVKDNVSPLIYRRIDITFKMPMFLTSAKASVTSTLKRPLDAPNLLDRLRPSFYRDGKIETTDVPFVVWIPRSAVASANASILQYGHGLFGDRSESTVGFLHQLVQDVDAVAIASDWWGLSSADMDLVREMITGDILPIDGRMIPWQNRVQSIMDRAAQAIVNKLVLAELVRTSSAMHRDTRIFNIYGRCVLRLTDDGSAQPVVDKSIFYGISLGGILGTTYMALTETIKTGIIGVPGAPFSTLVNRNPQGDFLYTVVLPLLWKTAQDRAMLLLMVTQLYDFVDPASFTRAVGRIDTASAPTTRAKKNILVQAAVGDALVSPIGGEYLMRSLAAVNIDKQRGATQSVYRSWYKGDPFGIWRYGWASRAGNSRARLTPNEHVSTDPDTRRSMTPHHVALQMFHYKHPAILPLAPVSPNLLETMLWDDHSCPRFTPQGKRQVQAFIEKYGYKAMNSDDDLTQPPVVVPACGPDGCWHLPRPPLEF